MSFKQISPALAGAMLSYWKHRIDAKRGILSKWNKMKDLKDIEMAAINQTPKIVSFAAAAGGFFFTWEDGVTTIHTEKAWKDMRISPSSMPSAVKEENNFEF